jgi:hypothetical protein
MKFILSRNNNNEPVYAIEYDDGIEIYNPNFSECGRFKVDAKKYYGLDQKTIDALALLNSFFNYSTEV